MEMHERKLLYVINSLEIGGTERHLIQIIINLKLKGWEPEIFVFAAGGPLSSYLHKYNIPVHEFFMPKWLDYLAEKKRILVFKSIKTIICSLILIYILWLNRPHIIHFFLPLAYICGGLASLLSPVPIKIMSRRSLNHYQISHPFLTKIEHWLNKRMTLICGNSMAVINNLKQEGVDTAQLRLIYNGIDIEFYNKPFDRAAARASVGISENTLVFIIVANLISYKGHADLITAFSMIKTQLPNPWLLLCLGRDDGISSSIKQQAKKNSIFENIQFLSGCNDVSDFLRMSDIGILSSHQEGFSNSVLEGMAAGLPMVVTNVGGNAEAVLDGEIGYVVPPKNPIKLSEALIKIVFNSDRVNMGQRGKTRVEKLFSLKSCIEEYEELYKECKKVRNNKLKHL